MCGIIGRISAADIDINEFNSALEFLADRGPNASGSYLHENVAIGHRRLAVIDLAANLQPLESRCKRFVIAYNGEIYNYLELNKVLLSHGIVLEHVNDTSVILELYILLGEKCLDLFNGMFAFAIWDNVEQCLFAARDRIGEKPFYYALNNDGFFFASTVSAIKKFSGVKKTISLLAAHEFLMHQYISADSIYSGISRLGPGCYLKFSLRDGLVASRYWNLESESSPVEKNNLSERIRFLVEDSVRIRLRSDVPVGLFLSGGLDSSILASIAKGKIEKVNSFCVGFDQKSYDESQQAKKASQFYGTHHHQIRVKYNDASLVTKIINILHVIGEPFADPAMVPMWDLCEAASKTVTVALSGDGADEIFGGYRRYYAGKYFPSVLYKQPFSFLLGKISSVAGNEREYFSKSLKKKIFLLNEYLLNRKSFPNDFRPKMFNEESISLLTAGCAGVNGRSDGLHCKQNYSSNLLMHQLTDVNDYLPNDILLKTDRISMHFGLEVRTPFLDHRLVEEVLFLPDSYKISLRQQKKVLREIFKYDVLPEAYKGIKHGFSPPLHLWLAGELAPILDAAISDSNLDTYVNRAYIKQLQDEHKSGASDHSHRLWIIVVFYLWLVYEAV
jgi:asparagine synthase (glutamine-hydrolysing)